MTDDPVDGAAEAKAAFHLRMRARGVRDLAVLRAFELVPRQTFVPEACRALALRDLALPIACGQTLDEPWLVARMIEALDLRPTHRVLQIGAGTGYATAILAQLAGEVTAYERYASLAAAAQARLDALGVANATIRWGDGLAADRTFDRVIAHGLLADMSPAVDRLAAHGLLVAGRSVEVGQQVMRIARAEGALVETAICPCRLQPIARGLAGVL